MFSPLNIFFPPEIYYWEHKSYLKIFHSICLYMQDTNFSQGLHVMYMVGKITKYKTDKEKTLVWLFFLKSHRTYHGIPVSVTNCHRLPELSSFGFILSLTKTVTQLCRLHQCAASLGDEPKKCPTNTFVSTMVWGARYVSSVLRKESKLAERERGRQLCKGFQSWHRAKWQHGV